MGHGTNTRGHRTRSRQRRALSALLAGVLVALGWAIAGGGVAHAVEVELSITETGFGPRVIEVLPGTQVTWTNDGTNAHDVVSDNGAFAPSGPLAPGESRTVILNVVGTYGYHSSMDEEFNGTIIVTTDAAASGDGLPSAQPVEPADTPAIPTAPDVPTSTPTEMPETGAAESAALAVLGGVALFLGWAFATGAGPSLGAMEPWRLLARAETGRHTVTDERLPQGRWRRSPRSTTQATLLPGPPTPTRGRHRYRSSPR